MDNSEESTVRVKYWVASALELHDPLMGNHVLSTRGRAATAVADLVCLRHPTTPQGIEMLSEIVLIVQDLPSMNANHSHRDRVGGTFETGWPINPRERLNDCIIAAADLGMFDPVTAWEPDQEPRRPSTYREPSDRGVRVKPENTPWPVKERLPDGFEQEFSPTGGQWIATRRFAEIRLGYAQSPHWLSVNAQFLWDLDHFLDVIVNALMEVIESP